jgi:hypothetical protein
VLFLPLFPASLRILSYGPASMESNLQWLLSDGARDAWGQRGGLRTVVATGLVDLCSGQLGDRCDLLGSAEGHKQQNFKSAFLGVNIADPKEPNDLDQLQGPPTQTNRLKCDAGHPDNHFQSAPLRIQLGYPTQHGLFSLSSQIPLTNGSSTHRTRTVVLCCPLHQGPGFHDGSLQDQWEVLHLAPLRPVFRQRDCSGPAEKEAEGRGDRADTGDRGKAEGELPIGPQGHGSRIEINP